jgi:uncharacterized protein YaaW (UPF0174 family)
MAYRQDEDLSFLAQADNADLDVLVKYITTTKNGRTRLTEELTRHPRYIANQPDHVKYWDLIAAEIQSFGANTFATLLRGGEGVLYKEVLTDVCKKLKVNFNKNSSVELIERNLLLKLLEDSLEKLTDEDLRNLVESLKLKTTSFSKQAIMAAIQFAIRQGGFASYKIALIVANAVAKTLIGRGLSLAADASLTKAISIFAGPIGWAVTAIWTAFDIAGPAYRVTIPCVIQIAYMRTKMLANLPEDEDQDVENVHVIIQCPSCTKKNRVQVDKLKQSKCGQCGSRLAE